jgi:hypothetical protein
MSAIHQAEPGVDRISWEILNCMADDCENLEQIYRGVCYDLHPIEGRAGPAEFHYRARADAPHLFEVVDHLRGLLEQGMVNPIMDVDGKPCTSTTDPSVLWRAWFAMTPAGRATWESSPFNAEES